MPGFDVLVFMLVRMSRPSSLAHTLLMLKLILASLAEDQVMLMPMLESPESTRLYKASQKHTKCNLPGYLK